MGRLDESFLHENVTCVGNTICLLIIPTAGVSSEDWGWTNEPTYKVTIKQSYKLNKVTKNTKTKGQRLLKKSSNKKAMTKLNSDLITVPVTVVLYLELRESTGT